MNLSAKLQKLIDNLFVALVAILPFIFFWSNDELFEFNKMMVVYGFTSLLTVLLLARMVDEKKILYPRSALNYPLGIFLCSQILSTIFSIHPYTSFFGYYTRLNGGLLSIICYSLLYYIYFANSKKNDYQRLLKALFISSIFVCIYAVGEHYGYSLSCLLIKGELDTSCWVQAVQDRVFATFGQPNWLAAYNVTLIGLASLLLLRKKTSPASSRSSLLSTAAGFLWPFFITGCFYLLSRYHPTVVNFYSAILSTINQGLAPYANRIIVILFFAAAILTFYLVYLKRRDRNFYLSLAINFNMMALIFTQSRSGILALFAGMLLGWGLLLIYWWRQQQLCRLQLVSLGIVIFGMSLPIILYGTAYTPSLIDKVIDKVAAQSSSPSTSTPPNHQGENNYTPIPLEIPSHLRHLDYKVTETGEIRKIVYRGALDIFRHYPLLGTGLETFAYSYYAFRPSDHNWVSEWDFLYNKAHNELLNYAANSGALGLLSYLSIFVVLAFITVKTIWQRSTKSETACLLIGINAGLLALFISNFFGFSTVAVQVLLYLYLAMAAQATGKLPESNQLFTRHYQRWQMAAFYLLGGMVLVCGQQIMVTWLADYHYASCKRKISRPGNDINQALSHCALAIKMRPNEATYQIELGGLYAQYASQLALKVPNHPSIQELTNLATQLANRGFALNQHNLNFYKTRFRTFISLINIDPNYLQLAKETLEQAMALSPTDPKLTFYYATTLDSLGDYQAGEQFLEKTLQLRPIYLEARLYLASKLWKQQQYTDALANYHFVLDYIDSANQVAQTMIASASAILNHE